jgi:hypothetical protein
VAVVSATASEATPAAQVARPDAKLAAADDHTAASQRLIFFDEIAETADLIQSFSIGLLEAARRTDRVRVHDYIADIVRCGNDARGAYARIAALAKLGGGQ